MAYRVEQRIGCVAVVEEGYSEPGLGPDKSGVVWYQHGQWVVRKCPTCGQSRGGYWKLPDDAICTAIAVCEDMNREGTECQADSR